ncbi:hypothetical protein B9Z65_5030 [Elsinoe australis]|uniref:Protein BCP1 n=1 Tax=Elsinoe australis TaxID=40998 RepID=A0A2P7ZCW3_9PEZI|nr:hypothetical protein B9Z65_5030 [Elsinoe australis]
MAKRKAQEANGKAPEHNAMDEDSGSEDDIDMLDVDFEWFGPQEQDFHGLKALLRQLLDADATLHDLSALADLILSQPNLGSTVKCEGPESDPFAFLTVLNLKTHATVPAIQSLTKYLTTRSKTNPSLSQLTALLSDDKAEIGLILTEKLINMPSEIVPPLYTMLLEEMAAARAAKEPYNFTHYLILSKTYTEVASELDTPDGPKKKKSRQNGTASDVFFFHPEDEVLQRHAVCAGGWDYEKVSEGGADSRRAFQEEGIKPSGFAVLIEQGKFEGAVKAVAEYLGGPGQG